MMKRRYSLYDRFLAAALTLVAAAMTACATDEEVTVPENRADLPATASEVNVTFTLALSAPSTGARAAWTDNENDPTSDAGDDFDNRIEPDNLQVFICGTDGKPFAKVDKVLYHQTADKSVWEFSGTFTTTADNVAGGCKVMILANCAEMTVDGYDADRLFPFDPAALKAIPMWGVKTVQALDVAKGATNYLGKIYLLRALSKVTVTLNLSEDQAGKYALTSVGASAYNRQGYIFPTGHATASDTETLDTESCFRPYDTDRSATAYTFRETADGVWTGYVNEITNTDGTFYLPVSLRNTETAQADDYEIRFCDYDAEGKPLTDAPMNVVRNHHYKFNITKVDEGADLKLELSVNPWDLVVNKLAYTNEVTVGQTMEWTGYKERLDVMNEEKTVVGYKLRLSGPNAALTGTFRIDTPSDAEWTATLIPTEGSDVIRFQDESGNTVKSVSGTVGKVGTLTIVTTATNTSEESRAARLEIVVRTADGRTIQVKSSTLTNEMNITEDFLIEQPAGLS